MIIAESYQECFRVILLDFLQGSAQVHRELAAFKRQSGGDSLRKFKMGWVSKKVALSERPVTRGDA